jgi:hypothetical protein
MYTVGFYVYVKYDEISNLRNTIRGLSAEMRLKTGKSLG